MRTLLSALPQVASAFVAGKEGSKAMEITVGLPHISPRSAIRAPRTPDREIADPERIAGAIIFRHRLRSLKNKRP